MTSIEKKLHEDLQQTEAELARLETLAAQLRWKIQYIRTLLTTENRNGSGSGPANALPNTPRLAPSIVGGPFAYLSAAAVIESLLREIGRPMRIGELADRAIAGGYGGPAADRRKVYQNFTSMLAKEMKKTSSAFKKTAPGIFELASRTGRDND
jgi:hypothetical protein